MIREVKIGNQIIGGTQQIMIQSMAATKTQDVEATLQQINSIWEKGAGLVRLAIDNKKDVEALKLIREQTKANLSVDLQENYLLAEAVAPYVQKIRYNPGHLHHLKKKESIENKVKWLVSIAKKNDIAMRIGVNCGSVAPDFLEKYEDKTDAIIASALYHCELLEKFSFTNFCVSLKDSDPNKVIQLNEKFFTLRPEIPLHLGVTEAGMPPEGVVKTRQAFEKLIPQGIGSTIRVSLTLPFSEKNEEIRIGKQIVKDIQEGKLWGKEFKADKLNIISCPSCSRVENEKFILLAKQVKELTEELKVQQVPLTIAIMGCRVNGPGETDDADIGLWCGPSYVNLKKGTASIGHYSYDVILTEVSNMIEDFKCKLDN